MGEVKGVEEESLMKEGIQGPGLDPRRRERRDKDNGQDLSRGTCIPFPTFCSALWL